MCETTVEAALDRARREGYDEGYKEGRLEMHKKIDGAFRERNRVVAALSKQFPSHLAHHEGGDNEFGKRRQHIVYIELPSGQVSWHIGDDELWRFAGLLYKEGTWDGHDTETKYTRLAALPCLNKDKILS